MEFSQPGAPGGPDHGARRRSFSRYSISMVPTRVSRKCPAAKWEWEHRSGFRAYEDDMQCHIEHAFQSGENKVRLKASQKAGAQPLEIFFADMLQIDHISGNTRRVQRVGQDGLWSRASRYMRSLERAWAHSTPRMESLEQFRNRRDKQRLDADEQEQLIEHERFDHTGWCFHATQSALFNFMVNFTVMVNSLWITVSLDVEDDSHWLFTAVPYLFLLIFVLEIGIRFGSYKKVHNCFHDSWFRFDAVLVFAMVLELCVLPVVAAIAEAETSERRLVLSAGVMRVLRVIRIARTVRLAHASRDLMTIVHGLTRAFWSMYITFLVLVLLIYVFAVTFRTSVRGTDLQVEETFFASVGDSMWTLLIRGVFMDDLTDLVDLLREEIQALAILFVLFIFLSSFTLLNMLIGIVCDMISEVKRGSLEKQARKDLKHALGCILECYDRNGTGDITKIDFECLLANPEFADIILRIGTEVDSVRKLTERTFKDDGTIRFSEVIDVVFRLRTAVTANIMDIIELREHVRNHVDHVIDALQQKLLSTQDDPSHRHSATWGRPSELVPDEYGVLE